MESQLLFWDVLGQVHKKGEEGTTTCSFTSNVNDQVHNLGKSFFFSCIISSTSGGRSELPVIHREMNLRDSGEKSLRQVWAHSCQHCKIQVKSEELGKSH